MTNYQRYQAAISLPTLDERSTALIAFGKRPSVRLSSAIFEARLWLAKIIAPQRYFEDEF